MGAVKNMAIELECNMARAAEITDVKAAYRLGMLEACRLIGEQQNRYVGQFDNTSNAFDVLHQTWKDVFDAAAYLREVANRDD